MLISTTSTRSLIRMILAPEEGTSSRNVTPNGHKTLLRESFQAGQGGSRRRGISPTSPSRGADRQKYAGEKRILEGGDGNWGSKRLKSVPDFLTRGKADFSTLGEHATWVKWLKPTAEAIRQACLAQESRISHSRY